MVATESLQIDDQNWWHIIHLNLLDCLFMIETTITVPSIGLRKFFWSVELPETIIDANTFRKFFTRVCFTETFKL